MPKASTLKIITSVLAFVVSILKGVQGEWLYFAIWLGIAIMWLVMAWKSRRNE